MSQIQFSLRFFVWGGGKGWGEGGLCREPAISLGQKETTEKKNQKKIALFHTAKDQVWHPILVAKRLGSA